MSYQTPPDFDEEGYYETYLGSSSHPGRSYESGLPPESPDAREAREEAEYKIWASQKMQQQLEDERKYVQYSSGPPSGETSYRSAERETIIQKIVRKWQLFLFGFRER